MAYTREHAEDEVKRFNEFFDTLSEEKQQDYYGGRKSVIENYEKCFRCSKNEFRPVAEGDGPKHGGYTIQPVIFEGDTP